MLWSRVFPRVYDVVMAWFERGVPDDTAGAGVAAFIAAPDHA